MSLKIKFIAVVHVVKMIQRFASIIAISGFWRSDTTGQISSGTWMARDYGNFQQFAFHLQPRFALALNRHWIAGLHPKFDFYYPYNDFYDVDTYFNRIWLGGFVRYAMPLTSTRLVSFLELGYQWEVSLSTIKADIDAIVSSHVVPSKSHRWLGSVGLDYFIHPALLWKEVLILIVTISLSKKIKVITSNLVCRHFCINRM